MNHANMSLVPEQTTFPVSNTTANALQKRYDWQISISSSIIVPEKNPEVMGSRTGAERDVRHFAHL